MMRRTAFLLFLIAAEPAFAGTKAIYSQPDDPNSRVQIEVADNNDLRIGAPDGDFYGLRLGQTFYLVWKKDNAWQVMPADNLAAARERLFKTLHLNHTAPPELTVEKRGPAQLNGRAGTRYAITATTTTTAIIGSREQDTVEVIISDDPALVPVGQGLQLFFETVMLLRPPSMDEQVINATFALRRVMSLGTPLDSPFFKFETVETAAIDANRLRLPAKPLSVEEIIADLTGAGPKTNDK